MLHSLDKMAFDAMDSGSPQNTMREVTEQDVKQIVTMMNEAYRVSKVNFIWKHKIEENNFLFFNNRSSCFLIRICNICNGS